MLRQVAALLVFTAWVSVPTVFATCAHAEGNWSAASLRAFHADNAAMHAVDMEEQAGIAEWNTNCARGDVNSQGLTDTDEGFVQDACPPGVTTYYYDAHVGRCVVDCRP